MILRLTSCLLLLVLALACNPTSSKINRKKLVERHKIHVNSFDRLSSLTLGNGDFAFTVDITGLQSYPEIYQKGIPLGTQSEWAWHSFPDTNGYSREETYKEYQFHNRKVAYDVEWEQPGRQQQAAYYFRQNPHRLHLGIIGFDLVHSNGKPVIPNEISSIKQILNPWNGQIRSEFTIEGVPVEVITYCHQDKDLISAQIKSDLLQSGQIRIRFKFPYPSGGHTDNGCNWNEPESHSSIVSIMGKNKAQIDRIVDSSRYYVSVQWIGDAILRKQEEHDFILEPGKDNKVFSFSCMFSSNDLNFPLPLFHETEDNCMSEWKKFWLSGAAIDFKGSTDERAMELERRIILSQYLTRIQCAENYPPQETGLTYNSWYGKFLLNMHWWHAVHYALWGRTDLLEKSLDYYVRIFNNAKQTAQRQGFKGCRWPQMTDPSGLNSPSSESTFLIWQQPHFIYLAELCYRNRPDTIFLKKYAKLVFATADFMASFAWHDPHRNKFILGPWLMSSQEIFPPENTINPPFELNYWYWGLKTAQLWKERLNLQRDKTWDEVMNNLSEPPEKDGLYLAAENVPDSYTSNRFKTSHPAVLATFGMLPGSRLVDTVKMFNTFKKVWDSWYWNDVRGWDFPMTSMTAVRFGLPEQALKSLFNAEAENTYLQNGHNYQNELQTICLAGNGALLTAAAMMCAGYDGCKEQLPGFPKDGKWKVRWEGLKPLP